MIDMGRIANNLLALIVVIAFFVLIWSKLSKRDMKDSMKKLLKIFGKKDKK